MWIALIVVGAVVIGTAVAGIICYYTLALPNMKPLTAEELALCRRIVAKRQGYPWLCRRAVRTGMCACQPCPRMRQELRLNEAR